jgi:hypothetical protein
MDENKNYQETPQQEESKGKAFFKFLGTFFLALVLAALTVVAINLGK